MSAVHDLRPMDLEEARAFLEAKAYDPFMGGDPFVALVESLPRPEQMLLRRALLTVGTADLKQAQAEITAAQIAQHIIGT